MAELLETKDMELTEHMLNGVYGSMRISARGKRHGMRLSSPPSRRRPASITSVSR